MTATVTSAPGKIILFGEHGIQRGQTSVATAIEMRTSCRVETRDDGYYRFRCDDRHDQVDRDCLTAFKAEVDALREASNLDAIVALTKDFFAPTRYVMASFIETARARRTEVPGLDVEWRSPLPIGSGLGSGAAASTSMVLAAGRTVGVELSEDDIVSLAWQGDVVAHGGRGSSLDGSTCTRGGVITYSLADKAEPLPFDVTLPLVVGDTLVQHNTSWIDSRVRAWVEESPERVHVFEDLGYLVAQFIAALERADLLTLGHLMNVHQLLQEKLGTSCPESERLIAAALGAGAYGAKISGSGGGGIVIALPDPARREEIAAAIEAAGGRSYIVQTGAAGVRIEES